jgi:hypothetical protein
MDLMFRVIVSGTPSHFVNVSRNTWRRRSGAVSAD